MLSALAGLALWHAAVTALALPPFLLPGPVAVAGALLDGHARLAGAALITLAEMAGGFALGSALGIVLALGMAVLAPLRRALAARPTMA